MALVAYSDSEVSDDEKNEAPVPTSAKASSKSSDKPAFQKITNASEPRKIKVDLPSVKPETTQHDDQQPPAKRARTAGAFSGFNSLLPAPKQPPKSAPKAGVSLKTSSEAVFSRAPPAETRDWNGDEDLDQDGVNGASSDPPPPKEEVKIVGKATKFKPLSVSNKKKPLKKAKPVEEPQNGANGLSQPKAAQDPMTTPDTGASPIPPKPKRSLFSMPQSEQPSAPDLSIEDYDPAIEKGGLEKSVVPPQPQTTISSHPDNSNSLSSVASDLNLTPAQRRQLFGRGNKGQDISITHFNLDSEYAANEELRQAGEVVEHRAVKAIAPGKHSLQQLVNNARTQQEGLEDKWAAGRQARGEGGSKYGWTGR